MNRASTLAGITCLILLLCGCQGSIMGKTKPATKRTVQAMSSHPDANRLELLRRKLEAENAGFIKHFSIGVSIGN